MLIWHKVVPGGNDRMIAIGDNVLGDDRVSVEVAHDGVNPGSTLVVGLAKDEGRRRKRFQTAGKIFAVCV